MARLGVMSDSPFFAEIDAAVGKWLHVVAVGGAYGTEALVRTEGLLAGATPREVRAALLSRAEDAFEALAGAGLLLNGEPELEFRRGELLLRVWFSVRRAD